MSGALIAGGAGLSSIGGLIQGRRTADALNYQADLQRNNATLALQSAKFDSDRQSIFANQKIGAAKAGYASSGVDVSNSGSALAVLGASASNAELDRQNILHGGEIKAINFNNQASMDEKAAKQSLQASYFSALGSFFAPAIASNFGQYLSPSKGAGGDQSGYNQGDYSSADALGSGGEEELGATGGAADLSEAAALA